MPGGNGAGGNGKNGPRFHVVKAGEGKVKKLTKPEQVDVLMAWVKENKHRLKGLVLCYELETDGDSEALGMKTTEMKYRDIQYLLLDGIFRTWAVTRGGK